MTKAKENNHQNKRFIEAVVSSIEENETLEYKGFFKSINNKVQEGIQIFVSDWNKEHWTFYVWIDKDDYEEDITNIQELISKMNYRDGDVYIELIDYEGELEHFYDYLYELGSMTQSQVLNPRYWEILEEKYDEHFLYFRKLNGSSYIDDLDNAEFITFQDWDEVLEMCNPDLYKTLDKNKGLCCFDIPHFFNCQGFHELNGLIVEENN